MEVSERSSGVENAGQLSTVLGSDRLGGAGSDIEPTRASTASFEMIIYFIVRVWNAEVEYLIGDQIGSD